MHLNATALIVLVTINIFLFEHILFFADLTVDLETIILVFWKWSNNMTQKQILLETSSSKNVLSKIVKKIRNNCLLFFCSNPIILGSNGILCQIDESLFIHTGFFIEFRKFFIEFCEFFRVL